MKKIIALAVASAFVAPAFAADITISGDVEFKYFMEDGDGLQQSLDGDSDFFVTASEEFDGMSVKFVVGFEDVAKPGTSDAADNRVGDAELHIGGPFGTVMLGNVDNAALLYDEHSHVAEDGGGKAILTGKTFTGDVSTATWVLPSMVEGLSLAASATIENGASANTTDDELLHTAIGAKYTRGNLTVTYGSINEEGQTTEPSAYGIQYAAGPITVAMEVASDVSNTAGKDATTFGATYNYGNGKLFLESNQVDTSGANEDTDIIGGSYKMGPVNLYLQSSSNTTSSNDQTTFGVEYAF